MDFWDEVKGVEFLKGGLLGFPKSGKTYTATLLAVAVRRMFAVEAPIAFFDTENGSSYVVETIARLTGKPPVIKRSRSFDDLMLFAKAIEEMGAVAIVDSITAPWRELCDAYLMQKNAARAAKGKKPVTRLSLPDWGIIKPEWSKWADFYAFSKTHLVICGRAGWEWEEETDEKGEEKLKKVGIKMKTEGEFGFEPSLLVEMERAQDIDGPSTKMRRRATVLGDRFQVLDGKSFLFESHPDDPESDLEAVVKAFGPHLDRLKPGAHSTMDARVKSDFRVDEEGDSEFYREKRERVILAEEAQGLFSSVLPGQTVTEKRLRSDILNECFGTRSWTAVEAMSLGPLRVGLQKLKVRLESVKSAATVEKAAPAEKGETVNA